MSRSERSAASVETDAPITTEPATPNTAPADEPASTGASDPSSPDTANGAEDEGASGVGDELFPDLGNPGIDVDHYDIDLSYEPSTSRIAATVTMSITATESLTEFTLDQIGLDVESVVVDGAAAPFDVRDPELIITAPAAIDTGTTFSVAVTYSTDGSHSSSAAGVDAGWFVTPLGSFTLNEPDGARTWMPSNDHPSDKASYRFAIHVPEGYTGVANGELESNEADGTGSVWVWNQTGEMTTYAIQVLTGPYTIIDDETAGGLPLVSAILEGDQTLMQPFLDLAPEQIEFFEQYFGPYPLDTYGIAMTDGYIGGAMEEHGRPLFSRDDFESGRVGHAEELLLSHELAHQWFGNAVSPARWQDIWLNESFATYAEWMWLDHAGHLDLRQTAASNLDERQDGFRATGDPGSAELFVYEVYEGGAVVLHALRLTVGDEVFFEILQHWVADNAGTSRTTEDFIATAESISGEDLTAFFDDWLFATDLPDEYPT